MTRRMGSLPIEDGAVREGQTDGAAVRFPRIATGCIRRRRPATLPGCPSCTPASTRRVLAALHDQASSSGAPVDHLVERALAEYLGVEHHTLYQVSTAGALVEGVYQGAVSVGVVREHGDFGLGTFEDLDGEMIVLDGHVFRVGSDGEVGTRWPTTRVHRSRWSRDSVTRSP